MADVIEIQKDQLARAQVAIGALQEQIELAGRVEPAGYVVSDCGPKFRKLETAIREAKRNARISGGWWAVHPVGKAIGAARPGAEWHPADR